MIHWDLLLLQSRRRHSRGRMEEAGDAKRSFVIFNAPPETTDRPTDREDPPLFSILSFGGTRNHRFCQKKKWEKTIARIAKSLQLDCRSRDKPFSFARGD